MLSWYSLENIVTMSIHTPNELELYKLMFAVGLPSKKLLYLRLWIYLL